MQGDELLVATGKGTGTGPNSAWGADPEHPGKQRHPYIASMIRGSIARVNLPDAERERDTLTQEVVRSNLMEGRTGEISFQGGSNPIHHVIYVIKENRTYDQLFGDIREANGDPSLVMYGEDITPNQHKLARQFGILDNFYDSGEVSGDGHVWSTSAITSDYTEKTWQINYRGKERSYDFEGTVGDIVPLDLGIPDVNDPATGYLWGNLARHNVSYRHYGEFVSTWWCVDMKQNSPASTGAPTGHPPDCSRKEVKPGEDLPANLGGGKSPYKFTIPLMAYDAATKPELRGHFDPNYADFKVEYPDQFRADEFLREFAVFVHARQSGSGEQLPQFVLLRLPNDHTAGTRAGSPAPKASVADNDLALGRVVEAVSHSAYWDDTAIFVLEDDAQDGADHVDAHRSIALVISKYSPGKPQEPALVHQFYTTVNMVHTMEALLGLPPMNNNDAARSSHGAAVYRSGRPACVHRRLSQSRQWFDLPGKSTPRSGSEAISQAGFFRCRRGRQQCAECDSVARRQGRCSDAGAEAHGVSGGDGEARRRRRQVNAFRCSLRPLAFHPCSTMFTTTRITAHNAATPVEIFTIHQNSARS